MICYKVVDDFIISRTFRKKKENTDEEAAIIVSSCIPNAKIMVAELPEGGELYVRCCELSDMSEEASRYDWFVSHDNANILCVAILAVIERYHLWKVLMDNVEFYEWMKGRIR